MSSYLTPYNIAIANAQKGFDVAGLRHDTYNAYQSPLHGGQSQGDAMRDGDFQMEGGDFWSDFADGFMSVMKPVGQIASAVAPFLGAGMSGGVADRQVGGYRSGRGLSGGDEIIDTEPALLNPDLNSTGLYHPSVERETLYSGGDFWSDLGNVASTVAPFLPLLGLGKQSSPEEKMIAVARQMEGHGFFDSQILPFLTKHFLGSLGSLFGAGLSGGRHNKVQKRLLAEFKALHKAGITGRGLSGGDFDWSTLASFAPLLLGLGMSGGDNGEPDMSFVEPFLSGYGMSGGDFFDDLGAGFDSVLGKIGDMLDSGLGLIEKGFDKVMPLVEKVGKVADTAGKITGAFSGKKGEGMSGGMTHDQDMNMADAMGDIFSGMGMSGGSLGRRTGMASDSRKLSGRQQLYKGGAIANNGQPPFNQITNAGMSGGRRGRGLSGGDTSVNAPYVGWNEAKNAPFVSPLGMNGGNSQALVAQELRGMVNQPYKSGGRKGGDMWDDIYKTGKDLVIDSFGTEEQKEEKRKKAEACKLCNGEGAGSSGGARCCFNAKKCNGTKHYRTKKGGQGNSESQGEIEATDALVNALASKNPQVNSGAPYQSAVIQEPLSASGTSGGRKRPASKWIEHVKAYSKSHGVSYKQALKDSKATYRGAGQSGGDFWGDLGNIASTVAPFLPLLL